MTARVNDKDSVTIPRELFDAMAAGLDAVDDLRSESRGVDGLHLNGDAAPWDDLADGGEFPWLAKLDEALRAVREWRGAVIGKGVAESVKATA